MSKDGTVNLKLKSDEPYTYLSIIFIFTNIVYIDPFLHYQGNSTDLESFGQIGGGLFYWKRRKVSTGAAPNPVT